MELVALILIVLSIAAVLEDIFFCGNVFDLLGNCMFDAWALALAASGLLWYA